MSSKSSIDYILKLSKLATRSKQPFKAVAAKRKKVYNLASLSNYIEGNGIIDWLIKHPETVDTKFLPAKFDLKSTLNSQLSPLYNKVLTACKQFKSKMLETSEYAAETILAMQNGYDVIFNTTLVYRPLQRKVKINMLVKSSSINKIFNTKYNSNAPSIYGSYHYVPVLLKSKIDKLDQLTLNVSHDILFKYQNVKPTVGYFINDKMQFTAFKYTEELNTTVSQGLKWLSMVDDLDKEVEISANAKICSDSPWCSAVKQIAYEQENISMLKFKAPVVNITENMDYVAWKSIDQALKKDSEWAENYYSSTGSNMKAFKEIMNNVILVNCSELDGIIYQCSVLNTTTDEELTFQNDIQDSAENCIEKFKSYVSKYRHLKLVSWETLSLNLFLPVNLILTLKTYLALNNVKFPYACTDDLDIIALRSLKDEDYAQLPVINFSLNLIAQEFYNVQLKHQGLGLDLELKAKFKQCMKDACIRPLRILSILKKMTAKM
jgi:hypothetical protein